MHLNSSVNNRLSSNYTNNYCLNNRSFKPSFQALHVADCGDLKLYRVKGINDFKFLKSLPDKIDLKKLMPNLSKKECNRWHEMVEYAAINGRKPENVTYIETYKDTICGILTYTPDKTTKLECICTWPATIGEKVKLAGKTLFYQLFKDFQELKGKGIVLEAITDGPFNTVKKYEGLGFKANSNVHPTKVEMEASVYKIRDVIEELSELIPYEKGSGETVNLFETVSLP